jgi:predicted permease
MTMYRNYLKIAWRGLTKNRTFSLVNILGLAVGMTVTLLIGLWVRHEYSFDRFLPDYEQAYQVYMSYMQEGEEHTGEALPLPLSNELREKVPGIRYVAECDWMQQHGLIAGDKKLYLRGARVGADFLQIFRFPMLQGNPQAALSTPYSIVLTQSLAEALFGTTDPMGQTVRFNNSFDLKVSGILADLPSNTSFYFKYLIPFSLYEQNEPWVKAARTEWDNQSFQIYTALDPEADPAEAQANIRNILQEHIDEAHAALQPRLLLHALKDWHLYNEFENGKAGGGYIQYIRMFTLIGILVLVLACINFMNLATARSNTRAREVGIRKAIGSKRKQLITQFLTESFLLTLLAAGLALFFTYLALPAFNALLDTELRLPLTTPAFWLIFGIYIMLTALLAGSRPALVLSSFQAVKVLKGGLQAGRSAAIFRKGLILLQFSCSIALIIGTMIIYRQVMHIRERPVGYEQERLLMTRMSDDLNENYGPLKEELLQSGLVESVAWSSSPVTDIFSYIDLQHWPGKNGEELMGNIGLVRVTHGYFETMGMEILSGRDFRPSWRADSTSIIINEAAARRLGLQEPLGQVLTFVGGEKAAVVGVVKDALMASPFASPVPTVFVHGRWGGSMAYRIREGVDMEAAIPQLAGIFNRHNPAYPYDYEFVDARYQQKFELESLISKLAALFAGLSIFVSCLGLFGLAAYLAEQRTKEIGIRKILGASVAQIWLLLSGEFLWLVLVSCLIAVPLSFYFLQRWLENYEYRISIGSDVFLMAGILALIITLLTISGQAVKAALAQPARSLREE